MLAGHASGAQDRIFQFLPTVAGEHYLISLYEAQFGNGLQDAINFDVYWNNIPVIGQHGMAEHGYERFFTTVTALGGDVLTIGIQNDSFVNLIDDISVEHVEMASAEAPEPATCVLLGCTLLLWPFARHVNRRNHRHSATVGQRQAGVD